MDIIKKYSADEKYTWFAVSPSKDIYLLIGCLLILLFCLIIQWLFFLLLCTPFRALEGKLYAYLPKDRGYYRRYDPELDEVRISLIYAPERLPLLTQIKIGTRNISGWPELFKELSSIYQAQRASGSKPIPFKIDAEPNIPMQAVIFAMNVCKKAGVEQVLFASRVADQEYVIMPPADCQTDGLPVPEEKPGAGQTRNMRLVGLIIPIGIAIISFIIIYLFRMRRHKLFPPDAFSRLKEMLKNRQYQEASIFCRNRHNPLCNIIGNITPDIGSPTNHLDEMVDLSIRQEVVKLCRRLNILLICGVGLLGLVLFGLIQNIYNTLSALFHTPALGDYIFIGAAYERSAYIMLIGVIGVTIIIITYHFHYHHINLAIVKLRARVYELIRVIKP